MSLSKEEVRTIARELITEIRKDKHEFWIDGEAHYKDHMQRTEWIQEDYDDLRILVRNYRMASNIFWKAFIGLAIVGLGALALLGLQNKGGSG